MATPYPVPPTVVSPSTTPAVQEASAAFAKIEPELAGVDPNAFVRITSDVGKSVSMGLGAIPAMMSFRAEIAERVPQHPIELLDKLQDYALAAWYAHILAAAPEIDDSRIQLLLKEATPLRARLMASADAFAYFGVFSAARLDEVRGGTGYLDTASDLVALAAMFKQKWTEVEPKALVTRQEVDRAEQLGTELIIAHGARVQPAGEPVARLEAADVRVRAYTLFVNAYDACRRALSYLRWTEGDVDLIAPSIFVRARARRSADPTPAETPTGNDSEAVTPSVPTPTE